MEIGPIFEKLALGVEAAAIAVIIVGIIVATIGYVYKLLRKHNATETFDDYRHGLARTLFYPSSFWLLPISFAPWRLTKRASKASGFWDSSS